MLVCWLIFHLFTFCELINITGPKMFNFNVFKEGNRSVLASDLATVARGQLYDTLPLCNTIYVYYVLAVYIPT